MTHMDGPEVLCKLFQFMCQNGDEIHVDKVCDGVTDCLDGSDEGNKCPNSDIKFVIFCVLYWKYHLKSKQKKEEPQTSKNYWPIVKSPILMSLSENKYLMSKFHEDVNVNVGFLTYSNCFVCVWSFFLFRLWSHKIFTEIAMIFPVKVKIAANISFKKF